MIYTVTINPSLDYVMYPTALDVGFTNRSSREEIRFGGKGVDVSFVLQQLDVPTVALAFAAGFTGDYFKKVLEEDGVVCDFIQLEEGFTRINVKLNGGEYSGGVETIVNGMGPDISEAKMDELRAKLNKLQAGDTLVLTGSVPKSLPNNTYEMLMDEFGGRGIRFVVDATGDLLLSAVDKKPFLIKPNHHELGALFDAHPQTPEECLPYARKLHDRGAANVIVSCGGRGSCLVDENGEEHIVPALPITLVNATGAGDSMIAGFLAMVDKGQSYAEALLYASACGTATALTSGMARRERIDETVARLKEFMASQPQA